MITAIDEAYKCIHDLFLESVEQEIARLMVVDPVKHIKVHGWVADEYRYSLVRRSGKISTVAIETSPSGMAVRVRTSRA